uniref:Anoctamin n=1 Tax=Anas zonorhyncha TaxID=75864 RepID=A0A8B9UJ26_9AVES
MGRVPARSRAWGPRGDTPVPTRSVSLPAPWRPYSCASTHNAGFVLGQALPRRHEGVFCVRGERGVPPGCSGGVGRAVPSRAEQPGAVLLFRPRCGHRAAFQLSPCPPGAAGSGGDEFVGSQPALGPCFVLGRGARSWGASVGMEQVRSRSGAGPAFPVFLGPACPVPAGFPAPRDLPSPGAGCCDIPCALAQQGETEARRRPGAAGVRGGPDGTVGASSCPPCRSGMRRVPVQCERGDGGTGHGDSKPPWHGHPRAGRGLCPYKSLSRGVTRGPWGPSPSPLFAAARGLPGFPWRPAAFSLSPFFLPFSISRRRGPAGARPHRGAAGRDKLFGKRLLQAGRYIMSHKAWMKTVPTENCDVLMTFPDTTDDHTLLWLLNHIRLGIPELIVQVRHHKHTRVYAFFVTATYESLLRGADEIGLRKPVKAEFGGGMRSFSCEEDYIYENIENELYFFTSQERQNIIRYWLENLRAKQGEALHNIHFLEGQPIIPELAARGVIQQVFPLHEQRILKRLMKSWVQAICEAQPLDEICDYFGVKIAMYFAWLGFYTSAMVYPAVFGSILYTFTESDQTSQDICCVVFAIFNVIWATLFLEEWKRRGAEFAYKWGTLDTPAESIEEPRPQFRGIKRISPVTSAEEFYYPPWKRLLFQCLVSLPVCLACLSFVFLVMLGCFQLQEFVLSIKELPRIIRFLPKIVLAVIVTTCDEVYKKIAYWLNDMENYRLQSAYEKHLIIKIVLLLLIFSLSQSLMRQLKEALLPFIFLHLHLSLIFFKGLLGFCWRLGVSKMLATLLITRQFLQNVKEVSQPHLYRRLRRGDLSLRSLREVAHAVLRLLARPRSPPAPGAAPEGSRGEKKCLNGGCGVPEEEEEEEERRESDSEDESALDCGLKLKKVSFIEKAERRGTEPGGPEDESFLEEGSPTMVEKGMDPASVFELGEDEDDAEGPPGSPVKAAEPVAVLRGGRRRRAAESREEEEGEEEGRKRNRASWIDPPEEDYSTQLTQAEVESCMKKYEDTFQDYQEMFIQFGYVVLFSSAFPLAAMCALVNNVIEIRSDAFKLCTGLQRPFGQRVESIGQWQKVMEAMGVLAIVVNCYLIAQCGQLQRLFPWLSPEGAIISVVVLEHFALLLKYVIQVAIPDIPAWVAEEMAKLEYQRREAFKKHERQAQHHFQQQQRRKREEEERQRHAEYQARKERESNRDEAKPEAAGQDPAHEKSQGKGKGSGGTSHGSDKPKRPSSLLATNNVMKLKQIIPLQGKFLSGGAGAGSTAAARSPQSPTGSDNKLPGFLSFKFLKSPETKRDAGTEKVQSPTKPFNPGKLFNFGKSEGASGNGAAATASPQPRPGPSTDGGERPGPSKSHLNGVPEDGGREEPEPRAEEESGGYKL